MKIKPNIALSENGFIFNPSTGDSYSVNPLGHEIIAFWQEGRRDEEIIELLLGSYKVDRPTLEKDIYDFRSMLQTYKIVE